MRVKILCKLSYFVLSPQKKNLKTTLQVIRETYHIVYNYIYVLQNKGNLEELFVTYNIDTAYKPGKTIRKYYFGS